MVGRSVGDKGGGVKGKKKRDRRRVTEKRGSRKRRVKES